MEPVQITDHAGQALQRLPQHLQGKIKLEALVTLLSSSSQRLEDVLFELLNERAISTAAGAQLDLIGTILDLPRVPGQSDSDYRVALFGRAGQLGHSGTPEELIVSYRDIWQAVSVQLVEFQPATAQLTAHTTSDGEDPVVDAATFKAMAALKAQGVRLILQVADDNEFLMLSDQSETDAEGDGPLDALHGLGDDTLTEGGGLARVL